MTDLRLTFRQCRRRPVPWLAAIVSLALGIGANTATFIVFLHVRPLGDVGWIDPLSLHLALPLPVISAA